MAEQSILCSVILYFGCWRVFQLLQVIKAISQSFEARNDYFADVCSNKFV